MKNRVIELPKPIEFTKERMDLASYTKNIITTTYKEKNYG